MADENEQEIAYERIVNMKFSEIVSQYGDRPSLAAFFQAETFRNHPTAANDFIKEVLASPEGPEDYNDCYHDPLRWRCKAHRAFRKG